MNSDHSEFYSLKADLSDFKFSGLLIFDERRAQNRTEMMERFDG